MKKLVLVVVSSASFLITGCMSTGDSPSLTNMNFSEMDCSQIEGVFKSYKDNMDNAGTASSVLSMVNSDVSAAADKARLVAQQAYDQSKRLAIPIMQVKDCNINI
jgi:hypothetical protein